MLLSFASRKQELAPALPNRSCGRDRNRTSPSLLLSGVKVGELLAQVLDLRRIVVGDIGLIGMQRGIVLVICLCRIESLQRHDLGHDRSRKNPGLVELSDVGLGDALLLLILVKNRRSVLRALVRTLTIELRGVVRQG